MKKNINILFAPIVILFSGCACLELPDMGMNTIEPIAVEKKVQYVNKPEMIQKLDKVNECKSCKLAAEKKVMPKCSETVNTVIYRASCSDTCGFPVSVRVPSNCQGSLQ